MVRCPLSVVRCQLFEVITASFCISVPNENIQIAANHEVSSHLDVKSEVILTHRSATDN